MPDRTSPLPPAPKDSIKVSDENRRAGPRGPAPPAVLHRAGTRAAVCREGCESRSSLGPSPAPSALVCVWVQGEGLLIKPLLSV